MTPASASSFSPSLVWVELCAGSAALTLALLLGDRAEAPVPWLGSKKRLARPILRAFGLRPGQGAAKVILVEIGFWATVWRVLRDRPEDVVEHLLRWQGSDLYNGGKSVYDTLQDEHLATTMSGRGRPRPLRGPEAVWRRLHAGPVPADEAERVAVWLLLQSGAAAGKPVQETSRAIGGEAEKAERAKRAELRRVRKPGRRIRGFKVLQAGKSRLRTVVTGWKSAGYAAITPKARARKYRERPQIPRIVRLTRKMIAAIRTTDLEVLQWDLNQGLPPEIDWKGARVLIDPPYSEPRSRYPASLPRNVVVELATQAQAAGAVVGICETEAVGIEGWVSMDFSYDENGKRRLWCGEPIANEWLTLSAPASPAWASAPLWSPWKPGGSAPVAASPAAEASPEALPEASPAAGFPPLVAEPTREPVQQPTPASPPAPLPVVPGWTVANEPLPAATRRRHLLRAGLERIWIQLNTGIDGQNLS